MVIRSRKSWGAARARPRTAQNPDNIRELFVHWAGDAPKSYSHIRTEAQEARVMRDIQAFHMGPERKWSDFAYNFAIFPSGRCYYGRGLRYVPAAQAEHNTNTAAVIVFIGPDDIVPVAVRQAIRDLRAHCTNKSRHNVRLRAHKDVTSTGCPGPKLTATVRSLA